MRCKCGQEYSPGMLICPNCGTSLQADVKEANRSAKSKFMNQTSVAGLKKKNQSRPVSSPKEAIRGDKKNTKSTFTAPPPDEEGLTIYEYEPIEDDNNNTGTGEVIEIPIIDDQSDSDVKEDDDWESQMNKIMDGDYNSADEFDDNEDDPDEYLEELLNFEQEKAVPISVKTDINEDYISEINSLGNPNNEDEDNEAFENTPAGRIRAKQKKREERMELEGIEYLSNRDGYYDDTPPLEPPEDDSIQIKIIIKWVAIALAVIGFIVFLMYYA